MSLYLKIIHPKWGEEGGEEQNIQSLSSKKKKKKSQSSKELFKLDPFYPICLVSQLFFLTLTHHKFIEYLMLARKFRHTNNRLVEGL